MTDDAKRWQDIIERNDIDEMRAEMERRLPMKKKTAARAKKLADLEIASYILRWADYSCVMLERVEGHAGTRWAVRWNGHCLNKDGKFEYEPLPSGRTDEFLARCRWESAEAAMEYWVESGAESWFIKGK